MATKTQIKKRRDNLFENFFQNGLALITAFIFSTALVGGLGYVLFNQKGEENAVYDSFDKLLEHSNDVKAWGQLLDSSAGGWFMAPETPIQLAVVYQTLKDNQSQGKLDPLFVSNALNWCANSLDTLSSEKGQIDGVTISDADYLIKAHQQAISGEFQGQIDLIYSMQDIITNWESETGAIHASKLLSIDKQIREQKSLAKKIAAQGKQIVEVKKAEQQQLEQGYAKLEDKMYQIQTKKNWSIAGVAIGVIWLVGLIIGAKKYYFR